MPRRPVRDWYSVEEAAHKIGVSISTIKIYILRGFFPYAEKVAGVTLIHESDILKLLKKREKWQRKKGIYEGIIKNKRCPQALKKQG